MVSATFTIEGLCGCLAKELDDRRYPQEYFQACVGLRHALAEARQVKIAEQRAAATAARRLLGEEEDVPPTPGGLAAQRTQALATARWAMFAAQLLHHQEKKMCLVPDGGGVGGSASSGVGGSASSGGGGRVEISDVGLAGLLGACMVVCFVFVLWAIPYLTPSQLDNFSVIDSH